MSDTWTGSLSDHLDGGLAPSDARELERHLETCGQCRETLVQLRAVRDRAAALVDPPAPDDLWAGIASRIGTAGSTGAAGPHVGGRPPRHLVAAWPLPAAAAAALALVLGAQWFAGRPARRAEPVAVAPAPAGTEQAATFDAERVEGEIAQLQRALDRGRDKLDPKTVAVLEKNLKLIRSATDDARHALAADPANPELQDYFAATVQSKLDLMRRATAMAGM